MAYKKPKRLKEYVEVASKKYEKVKEKPVKATKRRLKKAGLESVPGGLMKRITKTKTIKPGLVSTPKPGGGFKKERRTKVKRGKRKVTYNAIPVFPRF